MNSSTPNAPRSIRAVCPVCRKAVYSPGGIHPQCAMSREYKGLLREPILAPLAEPCPPWTKRCPRCKHVLHVKRDTCDCGYCFQSVSWE